MTALAPLPLSPLAIIHAIVPDLHELPRAQVEAYLANVAKALMEGWGVELEEIAEQARYSRDEDQRHMVESLLTDFKSEENFGGIMKSSVMVNHQWVIKLGFNAIQEMQEYADNEGNDYQDIMVPCVWLGDCGCLALKIETPKILTDFYQFEDNDHEAWYQDFKCDSGVPDCHRGNVGIWQDRMVAIDWGGGA